MAHPQHQYAPRYSPPPPRSTPSPHPGAYQLPPNKRQRLSPNPQSPYTSPSITNGTLPNQIFSSPHFGAQPNGHQSRPYPDAPQPHQPAGSMLPPSRPIEKPVDVNDLSDVLLGSGVDLKEEEAALYTPFDRASSQANGNFFTSEPNTSFGPSGNTGYQPDSFRPYNQFNTLSQNVPGDKNSFYGAGTFNQPAIPVKSLEQQAEEQRKRAVRRKAEREQYHLNDPFLFAALVRQRLVKHTHATHVSFPTDGLLTSQGARPQKVAVTGPDQNEAIIMLNGQDLLYTASPMVELLTLVSLAAQERLRTIVEDTAAIAKGRRVGSHGVIPPELADLAVGTVPPEPASLPTPGNSAVSPRTNPLKRSFSDSNNLPTPVSEDGNKHNTIAFTNQTVKVLRKLTTTERSIEEERASKRSKRTVNGLLSGDAGRSGSVSGAAPGPGTPGTMGERAPDVDVKKLSKKDQKKQADSKATEAQQHAATNQTLKMQLGGSFGKKQPSWLTNTKATPSVSGFPIQSRMTSGGQSHGKSAGGTGPNGAGGLPQNRRQFGDFREDKEGGAGIQMRDVVTVLDPESKEKKTLAKAYVRLNSKR
ncbi:hypothetical protein MMC34_000570 [Xylographa carneopallida]|nr:hypothetical protein [Xylographa carneopallida]